MQILGISGSLRADSWNTKLVHLMTELAAPAHQVEIADYRDVPLYNGDVEALGMPASVDAVAGQIATADALFIATPEYNFAMPGVLKNLIDWVSRLRPMPLAGKPVAIAGASAGRLGTALAQQQIKGTLGALGADIVPTPMVFVAAAHDVLPAPDDALKDLIKGEIKALEGKVG